MRDKRYIKLPYEEDAFTDEQKKEADSKFREFENLRSDIINQWDIEHKQKLSENTNDEE